MHPQFKPMFGKGAPHAIERVGLHVEFAIGLFYVVMLRVGVGNDRAASERPTQIAEFKGVSDGFVRRRFFM
jgi:hypothetical protein